MPIYPWLFLGGALAAGLLGAQGALLVGQGRAVAAAAVGATLVEAVTYSNVRLIVYVHSLLPA